MLLQKMIQILPDYPIRLHQFKHTTIVQTNNPNTTSIELQTTKKKNI